MEKGLHVWELENGVKLVDPKRDALYNYDDAAQKAAAQAKPWAKDRNYFKHVRISAVALIKMMLHARSGGRLEIMGLMQGYVDGDTFIVTDAFRLPVEGTETRVNVQDEANEYIIEYLDLCRAQGKQENVVGWYHSHPGYGCWLSGIDVDTQSMQQQFQDPFLAVVIDPDRTVSAGKVEIGAFRTFPPGTNGNGNPAGVGTEHEASNAERFQTVPLEKAEQFGAHANRYYSLEVSHFKSSLDAQLLESLWHKYWVQTLSQNPLLTNRDYGTKQMLDIGSKMGIVASNLTKSRGQQSFGSDRSAGTALDTAMDQSTNDVKLVASRDRTGLLASEVKAKIFNGLGTSRD